MKISLFVTCYNDTLFPDTGKAVVRLLERLGHSISFPAAQTCCGQMHVNTGYWDEALPLLPRFVAQFQDSDAVVVPSSSCVARMREHYPKMAQQLESLFRRLPWPEQENSKLKRLVANLSLDNLVLKDFASGNF